jgi:hypothetical protein
MPEWALVFLAGCLGAVVISLIDERGAIRTHYAGNAGINRRVITGWLFVTGITAIGAGSGSLLVWAFYTTIHVTGFDWPLYGESFVVGLGGVEAVRRYTHQSARRHAAESTTTVLDETVRNLGAALEKLEAATRPPDSPSVPPPDV